MDERVIEFTNYFEDVFWQEPVKTPISNDQAGRLAKKLFYRGVITDIGYTNVLRELGIYHTGE